MVLLSEAYVDNLLEDVLCDKSAVQRWTTLLNRTVSGELIYSKLYPKQLGTTNSFHVGNIDREIVLGIDSPEINT